jgi:GNAT superfamily N-acetyltransferase
VGEHPSGVSVFVTDPDAPDALALVEALWNEVEPMYGNTGPCELVPADVAGEGAVFVVAWYKGEPVGCGAVRRLEPGIGEVKRIYVAPQERRQGVAQRILAELEELARDMGYTRLHLETGTLQPEAMRLYERFGYKRVPPFGRYVDDPRTVCYGKQIAG